MQGFLFMLFVCGLWSIAYWLGVHVERSTQASNRKKK